MSAPSSTLAQTLLSAAARLGAGLLALLMAVVLARFLALWDVLRLFTAPMALGFLVLGWVRPSMGLYPITFFLPLLPLMPFVHGVANFSLAEIAWWAMCIGQLTRFAFSPRPPKPPPPPSWPLLTLLTVAVAGSAIVRLMRNFLWSDPIAWLNLWEQLPEFFRWPQESRFYALRSAAVWLESVAFLALIRRHAPRDNFQRRMGTLLILSLTAVALLSLHQVLTAPVLDAWQLEVDWLPAWLPIQYALHGPWPDVNSFASYLLLALPFVLSMFVLSRNVFARAMLLVLGAGTVTMILLTFSRIAWIWMPMAVGLWILFSRGRSRALFRWVEGRGRLILAAGTLGLIAGLTVLVWPERGIALVTRVAESPVGDHLNVVLKGRINLWERALRVAHEDPLFGCGQGSFFDRGAYHNRREAGVTSWGQEVWNPPAENAHNQFLQIFTETGAVGLALALFLMGQWLRIALRVAAWGKGADRWTARALIAGVLALGGTLLTGHALLVTEMLFLFWVFVGLAFIRPRGPGLPRTGRVPPPWSGRAQVALVVLIAVTVIRAWAVRGAPELVMYATGLHPPEPDGTNGFVFQWTRDEATLMVRNLRGECAFFLSNARLDQHPVDVEVTVNGEFRERVRPAGYHWWPYRFPVDLPPNTVYRVHLRVLDTFRNPSDATDRVLGIRLRDVSY